MAQVQGSKKVIFYTILVLLPIILLVIAEYALRSANFGKETPLFIENPYFEGYWITNPKVITRYFPSPEFAPKVRLDTVVFKKDKPKSTFRIFIQGGSTAAGFPYGRWGSLQGMLEQRFKRLYPNKDIEIINTAMASVNSFTLLDFSDEIIEQKPDLVLIYAGHNEYLGVMGVGSAFAAKGGRAATLLYLKLKNLKLYKFVEHIYYSFFLSTDSLTPSQDKRSVMAQIAKEKDIPYNSDLYHQGIEQFSGNMKLLLNKYKQAGIPVMLSNLASNEQTQAPFDTIKSIDWQAYTTSLTASTIAKQNIANLEQQLKAQANSELYFKLALNYLNLNDYKAARLAFTQAKDHDPLRFRAPSEFNKITKALASKFDFTFVDSESYFSKDSDTGIIGDKHMLEHLHPTARGYFILAEAFSDAIKSSQLLGLKPLPYEREKAWLDIPLTKFDKMYGEYQISKLKSDYPFTSSPQTYSPPPQDSIAGKAVHKRLQGNSDWLNFQNNLRIDYQNAGDYKEAAKIAATISNAMINQHQHAAVAGNLYLSQDDYELALYYYRRADTLLPSNKPYLIKLAEIYFELGERKKSMALIKRVKTLGK